MMRTSRLAWMMSFVLATAACGGGGDDPVAVSDVVGIELKADEDKVVAGTVTDEKNINTESGNPYGAFIGVATQELGHAPGRIEVDRVEILVGANSDVTALNQIFEGEVEVLFVMNGSNDTIPVASRIIDANVQGAGPLELTLEFDPGTLSTPNFADLISGNFKVVYRGPAAVGYGGGPAKCNLQINFTFAAFAE